MATLEDSSRTINLKLIFQFVPFLYGDLKLYVALYYWLPFPLQFHIFSCQVLCCDNIYHSVTIVEYHNADEGSVIEGENA